MFRFAQLSFAFVLVLCLSATSQAGGFNSFRAFSSPVVVERQVVRLGGRPVVVERFVAPRSLRLVDPFSVQQFRVQSFSFGGGCR